MANENKPEESRNTIDSLNDSLTGMEQKVQNNQRIIMWACVAVAAVVCLVFLYVYAFQKPRTHAADNAIGQADTELFAGNDSLALVQYQDVADNYGGDAANRAALNAAILLYKDGKYEEAISYIDRFDSSESIIGAGAMSLKGDCYVNLDRLDQAVECYKKAIKESDRNPHYTPFFMMKEATVLAALKDYKAEAAVYSEILSEYPEYGMENRIDIQKYLDRAEALAAEQK